MAAQRSQLSDFLLALVAGVLLIFLLFLAYYLTGDHYGAKTALVLRANNLTLVDGMGERKADGLEIRQVSAAGTALAKITEINLPADRYSRLQWSIDGLPPQSDLRFVWSTREAPSALREIPLPHNGMGSLDLDAQPFWKGSVFSVGLALRGNLQQPLIVHSLEFRQPVKPGLGALLTQLWAEWTTVEAWSQGSINFVLGTPPKALLPPVPAAAAWITLSSLLYAGLSLKRRRPWTLAPFIGFFLIGWMVLDARWQSNLWRQLDLTREQYAGKSWEEQRLAGEDGPLFAFIQEVKKKLPAKPVRIFLLSADPGEGTRYIRSRAHYHLLPHNVNSSFAQLPTNAQPGDYVLILRPIQGIHYDRQTKTLSMTHGQGDTVAVEPVYGTELGALFRVRGANGNS